MGRGVKLLRRKRGKKARERARARARAVWERVDECRAKGVRKFALLLKEDDALMFRS